MWATAAGLKAVNACFMAENGLWYLRKSNVLLDPLRRQKTLTNSGFFGAVSFLFRKDGATGRT